MSGFKDGGQVIVPVLLEFTGGDITFPAFFIVVVLKIQMVFGSYLKRN